MPYILASVHAGNHYGDGSGLTPIYTQEQSTSSSARRSPS